MPEEKVGIRAGMSIKKETINEEGGVEKTIYFFPDLDVSVEASNAEEARKLAEEKAVEERVIKSK